MDVALQVLGALLLLVLASDSFTNAVEWVGALAGLTRSAVGAVLAAVGSSLPETVVAFIALVLLGDPRSVDVGIGAVIGAPLMLSTVVFSLIGVGALAFGRKHTTVEAHASTTIFGLALFCLTFALVIGASFAPTPLVRACAALAVLAGYAAYLVYHIRAQQQEGDEAPPPLRIAPRAARPKWGPVAAQLAIAIVVTVFAARWFVVSVSTLAAHIGVSALLASLVLSPIATELPEALNVLVWTRRDEDELALGNVIGAMMFQTSVASTIALLATPWHLDAASYRAAAATLAAALLVLVWTRRDEDELALGNVIGAMMFQTSVASTIALLATPWHLDAASYRAAEATLAAALFVLVWTILRKRVEALPLILCGLFYVGFLAIALAAR